MRMVGKTACTPLYLVHESGVPMLITYDDAIEILRNPG